MEKKNEKDKSLRGTLLSVMILGTLIIVSWLGVFSIYISRN